MIAVAPPLACADRDIATQIASHLADTNRANLRRLSVDVHAGEVTLRGCVASYYEKQIAIRICRMFPGIDRLIDSLEVAYSC